MSFVTNEVIEIEASHFRVVARVRNVMGERIHVALEQGGYLPWSDAPVVVRRLGDTATPAFDGRILHASGTTAMIELVKVTSGATMDPLAHTRDTATDET